VDLQTDPDSGRHSLRGPEDSSPRPLITTHTYVTVLIHGLIADIVIDRLTDGLQSDMELDL
jgi:hypothetical protein